MNNDRPPACSPGIGEDGKQVFKLQWPNTSAVWPFMEFFPSKYSAKCRRNYFRWRLVITIWYLVPYATVITKRHSNISAIRHRSEILMLKCKRQARSELFFPGA